LNAQLDLLLRGHGQDVALVGSPNTSFHSEKTFCTFENTLSKYTLLTRAHVVRKLFALNPHKKTFFSTTMA
jgi:hypothetical protein